jgi:uroporphyrinogen decarboxylase
MKEPLQDTSFLKALRCQELLRPPVWLMRQAGRYIPEYQVLRKRHSLWDMFHSPELAVEVTKQPLELLGVDAAILFSDILVIAEALGLSVRFLDKAAPRVEPAIHTKEQVASLSYIPVVESLNYVFETIRRLKKEIAVPLIGFSGAPFTLASYFIDSSYSSSFAGIMRWMKEDPKSLHLLLSKIAQATIFYLQEQVRAGVDALQVFDSWSNILDDAQFATFCVPYLQQIIDALSPTGIPVILFCRNSSLRSEALAKIKPAGISFDWHVCMAQLRKEVPPDIAVQGNFDPAFLKLPREEIKMGVKQLLDSMRGQKGFIVNLGHGVTPDTPFENVRCFVDAVKLWT